MRLNHLARRSVAAAFALALLPATGCFGSGSANADPGGPVDDDGTPEPETDIDDPYSGSRISTEPLATCTRGLSPQEIEDAVAITFDFEGSAHEMVACGGLVFGIVGALVEGIVELVEDPSASTLPEGYRFDDQGTYYVEPAAFTDLRMEVRFFLGRDYSFGTEGELVTENLFLMSSYLQNPESEVHIDTSSGWPVVEVEITHDGPGPLVELLGLGAAPASPIVVTEDLLATANAHLADMQVESIIFFADHPGVSTIEYDVESPRMLADAFLRGTAMDLAMVGADGWRSDLEQDLDVDVWTVEYADGVGALAGDIDFTVRGGPFDFVSRFHYDGTGWPVIELACAP
jgi:hypothetical protein